MGKDSAELLWRILDSLGYAYCREGGEARLTMGEGGRAWQAVCRINADAALIYSAFPFEISDAQAATRYCSEVNAQLMEGCLFVDEKSKTVIVRCTAMRTDDFYIEQQLQDALARSAAIMRRHWAGLHKAAVRL